MNLRSKLSSLREYLTPINNDSNFHTTGEISPEEFVKAGDYLVFKFPTWLWGTCPPALRKKHLPADKQFLVTRHVPSYRRVLAYLPELVDENGEDYDEEWGITQFSNNAVDDSSSGNAGVGSSVPTGASVINDLDDLIEDDVEDDLDGGDNVDANIKGNTAEDFSHKYGYAGGSGLKDDSSDHMDGPIEDDFTNIDSDALLVRKYDLYISYSTSYRVPKMYLVGFNANGIPLLPEQMYEDISGDYKDKTATIESLPMSYNTTSVSIHPCKHSSVMKVFMKHSKKQSGAGNATEQDTSVGPIGDPETTPSNEGGIRVDQYLVVFLKFISSVTPGIEYDFTMDAL